MRKTLNLVLASAMFVGSAFAVGSKVTNNVDAGVVEDGTSFIDFYTRNYDDFNEQETVWSQDQLFWAQGDLKVATEEGKKGIEYVVGSNDEYSVLGGIGSGTINNLSKLVAGQNYKVSFYVKFYCAAEADHTLWVELKDVTEQNNPNWTGVQIHDEYSAPVAWTTKDGAMVEHVVSFEFTPDRDGSNLYFKLTAQNFKQGDKVFIDDVKISAVDTIFTTHFANEDVNDCDVGTATIDNLWGQAFGASTVVKQNATTKAKYVNWGAAPGENVDKSYNWSRLYVNDLTTIEKGAVITSSVKWTIEEGTFGNVQFQVPTDGKSVGTVALKYTSDTEFDGAKDSFETDSPFFFITANQEGTTAKYVMTEDSTIAFALDISYVATFSLRINSINVAQSNGNCYKTTKVNDAIDAIGTVVLTEASKKLIDDARKAYDDADEIVQGMVVACEKYKVLTDAEAQYKLLEDDEAAVQACITAINDIGTVEFTDACKGKIEAAEAAYDGLKQELQGRVTNYKTLTDAREEYDRLANEDKLQKAVQETVDDLSEVVKGGIGYEYTRKYRPSGVIYKNVDFRLQAKISNKKFAEYAEKAKTFEYGMKLEIETNASIEKSRTYNFTTDGYVEGNESYVVLDLGDILNNPERITDKFTFSVWAKCNGTEHTSENSTTLTVKEVVEGLLANAETKASVADLVKVFSEVGVELNVAD